jgi:hypothetical protein
MAMFSKNTETIIFYLAILFILIGVYKAIFPSLEGMGKRETKKLWRTTGKFTTNQAFNQAWKGSLKKKWRTKRKECKGANAKNLGFASKKGCILAKKLEYAQDEFGNEAAQKYYDTFSDKKKEKCGDQCPILLETGALPDTGGDDGPDEGSAPASNSGGVDSCLQSACHGVQTRNPKVPFFGTPSLEQDEIMCRQAYGSSAIIGGAEESPNQTFFDKPMLEEGTQTRGEMNQFAKEKKCEWMTHPDHGAVRDFFDAAADLPVEDQFVDINPSPGGGG